MNTTSNNKINFNGPAYYQITVQGEIPPRFFDQFSDFKKSDSQPLFPGNTSTVTGKISDQAQLTGILNSLYSMHFVVLEVSAIKNIDND